MDKINTIQTIIEFESLIPKFQGLRLKGLEFEGLEPGGLDPIDLKFESLVLDPSVLDLRPCLGGRGLDIFLDFDFFEL
jgi:hypothetical protein